jgi:hypothetical protein
MTSNGTAQKAAPHELQRVVNMAADGLFACTICGRVSRLDEMIIISYLGTPAVGAHRECLTDVGMTVKPVEDGFDFEVGKPTSLVLPPNQQVVHGGTPRPLRQKEEL